MAPVTRSAAPKSAKEKKSGEIQVRKSPIAKTAARKSAKTFKKTGLKRRIQVAEALPAEDEIRAAIRPEGTTMDELLGHFGIQPEHRNGFASLLVSMNLPNSAMNPAAVDTAPFTPGIPGGLFNAGFRPADDELYQPSPAEIEFGKRDTLFAASPANASSTAREFSSPSPRRSIFERTASMTPISPATRRTQAAPRGSIYGKMPSTSTVSATTGASQAASPRTSIFGAIPPGNGISPTGSLFDNRPPRRGEFGRMASVSNSSPARLTPSGGFQSFSPRMSIFSGTVSSLNSSPRTPKTPQSHLASGQGQPAKITVSASTKQEAESVLARQQLVRESLFELRGIITNLNWKVQQFEALVDRAEKDVIWDTASIVGVDQGAAVKSWKKSRVSFGPSE